MSLATLWLLSALPFLGEAQNLGPRAPDLEGTNVPGLTLSKEKWIGEVILYELRASLPIVTDVELNEYLQSLGNRLASAPPVSALDLRFLLTENETINAFATFGGNVVIFSGLLMETENESELAGILAHETVHAIRRHAPRMLQLSKDIQLVSLLSVAAAIIGAVAGQKLETLGLYAGVSGAIEKQLGFSRVFENEADRFGMERMAATGFNPRGMPAFFRKLWSHENARLAFPEYLRSHPLTENRLADSLERASKYRKNLRGNSEEYRFAKARLEALLNPQKYQNSAFPDNPLSLYRQGVALIRLNKAKEALRVLRGIDKPGLTIDLAIARAHLALRQADEAASVLARLDKLHPGRMSVSFLVAETRIQQGKFDAALQRLAQLAHLSDRYPEINALRSKAASAAKKDWLSHEYLGDYYWLTGHFVIAIEQFKLAEKSAKSNRSSRLRTKNKIQELTALREKILKQKR